VVRFKALTLNNLEDIEKFIKISVKIFGVPAEIRIGNPANISQKCYHVYRFARC
jgi:hypothetical protein